MFKSYSRQMIDTDDDEIYKEMIQPPDILVILISRVKFNAVIS